MEKVTDRSFKVNYFEKEEEIWIVEAQLKDDDHNIEVTVEIDMAEMTIIDSIIKFNKYPIKHCSLIQNKAIQMKGLKIDNEFSRNAMKIFMGPEGCPNIMSLLNISIPGIVYFYYPHKIKTGKMEPEQFDNIIKTELKNACLAHTLL